MGRCREVWARQDVLHPAGVALVFCDRRILSSGPSDDQGGLPPLGFRRTGAPPRILEVDPDTIGKAVALFQRYAVGTVSIAQLAAETGFEPMRIQQILRNPVYNGWVRRHRGPTEERRPASWRSDPPVSDDLWATVERVRRVQARGGGPRRRARVDLLAGLLVCVCGRRVRGDGRFADGRHRKLHPEPCDAWETAGPLWR